MGKRKHTAQEAATDSLRARETASGFAAGGDEPVEGQDTTSRRGRSLDRTADVDARGGTSPRRPARRAAGL